MNIYKRIYDLVVEVTQVEKLASKEESDKENSPIRRATRRQKLLGRASGQAVELGSDNELAAEKPYGKQASDDRQKSVIKGDDLTPYPRGGLRVKGQDPHHGEHGKTLKTAFKGAKRHAERGGRTGQQGRRKARVKALKSVFGNNK